MAKTKRKKLYIPHGNIAKMNKNEGFSISTIKNAQNYTNDTELQCEIRRVAKERYGAVDVWLPQGV